MSCGQDQRETLLLSFTKKADAGNEKCMSLLPLDKRSRRMEQQFVRGANSFTNLCVRKLPLEELLQNCLLAIQSTQTFFHICRKKLFETEAVRETL